MGRVFILRDLWKHGDVDASLIVGSFATVEAAQAWMSEPGNAWSRDPGRAHESASDRVICGQEIESEPEAVRLGLKSLEVDDLSHAAAAVVKGSAVPAHLAEVVQRFVDWERQSHGNITMDHDEEMEARDARCVAQGLARLALAICLKAKGDIEALLCMEDGYNPSLMVDALRQMHREGVALPRSVDRWLKK